MKKITLFVLLYFVFNSFYGQTTLAAGDIVFTGVITRGASPDQFSFVLLTSVTAGTTINFTDIGWDSSLAGGSGAFSPESAAGNDSVQTWTASSDLACGTEIIFLMSGINNQGDQLLAYQGTYTSPSFIAGISFADNYAGASELGVWVYNGIPANMKETNSSDLPSPLVNGTDAFHNDNDNIAYDCSDVNGVADILSEVNDIISPNWTALDNTNPAPLGNCTYTCCDSSTTWDGTSWSPVTPNSTTEAIINADYDTSAGGSEVSFDACTVTVNSGFTLTVEDGDYIDIENDVRGEGNIVVETSGNFIQNDDSGAFALTGTAQVNKTTTPASTWLEYTLWSSPVSGETIDGALADTDPNRRFSFNASNFVDVTAETNNNNATVTGQDDVDDNGDDWQFLSGSTTLDVGVGYATTQAISTFSSGKSYTFTGSFNTRTVNVPVFREDTSMLDNNWNLIGNPYPSAIEIDEFLTQNAYNLTTNPSGLLEGVVYFWSHNSALSSTNNGNQGYNFDTTDYASHNGVGGTVGGDGVIPNGFIPSGQGFFVNYSDDAASNTGNVTFTNAMRSTSLSPDNSQFFKGTNEKTSSTTANKLWINLTSDNGVLNQTLIGYVNGATNDFDGSYYDASKIVSPNAYAALYSSIENSTKKFVIQGKAPSDLNENEVIKLGMYITCLLYTSPSPRDA